MAKCVRFCFALVSTGLICATLGLGANYASAADDCVTNRKCWFLMRLPTAPEAAQTRRTLQRLTARRVSPEHGARRKLLSNDCADQCMIARGYDPQISPARSP
jgi:hypothetical protein